MVKKKKKMESFTAQCLSLVFRKISIGSWKEVIHRDALKAGVAEFISTLIFVFAGSGCDVAIKKKLANGGGGVADIAGLIATAIAHAFAFIVAVSVGANISGGHVNPAITFGVFVGGHITLFRSLLYWISQLLGSTAAVLLLKFVTDGLSIPAFSLSAGLGVWNAVVFEIVMTFGLVYTVYATAVDPRRGNLGTLAPMTIGFIIGANILAGWAFEGASMNPALSFGPALVSWTWTSHWVYWVGPLIGGGLAAFIYNFLFLPTPLELPTTDY